MGHRTEVKITRAGLCEWLVWLDGLLVGRFVVAYEALAYADLLECDPRVRSEALGT